MYTYYSYTKKIFKLINAHVKLPCKIFHEQITNVHKTNIAHAPVDIFTNAGVSQMFIFLYIHQSSFCFL